MIKKKKHRGHREEKKRKNKLTGVRK